MVEDINREHRPSEDARRASMLQMSLNSLKWPVLINGGAAVSMLGYIGSASGDAGKGVAWALLMFTLGVFIGAAASGLAYISDVATSLHIDPQPIEVSQKTKGASATIAAISLPLCIAFVIGSYFFYLLGGLVAFLSFVS